MPRLLLVLILLVGSSALLAADVIDQFDNPEQGEMYHSLLREYRCLKCQNQNLADSNASLAGDLRREIKNQIVEGKNQQEIEEYLVSRYGEFVLYRPRFTIKTAVLWIAPFVLLAVALIAGYLVSTRQKYSNNARVANFEASDKRLEKARKLLDE